MLVNYIFFKIVLLRLSKWLNLFQVRGHQIKWDSAQCKPASLMLRGDAAADRGAELRGRRERPGSAIGWAALRVHQSAAGSALHVRDICVRPCVYCVCAWSCVSVSLHGDAPLALRSLLWMMVLWMSGCMVTIYLWTDRRRKVRSTSKVRRLKSPLCQAFVLFSWRKLHVLFTPWQLRGLTKNACIINRIYTWKQIL